MLATGFSAPSNFLKKKPHLLRPFQFGRAVFLPFFEYTCFRRGNTNRDWEVLHGENPWDLGGCCRVSQRLVGIRRRVGGSTGMLLQGVFPDWGMLLPLTIGGLGGSLLGSFLLPKIPTDLLRRLFGVLLIYGGVRMFL